MHFLFGGNFRQLNRNSKGYEKKKKFGNSEGEEGLTILEFSMARGVKIFMPPMVRNGYFLESPNVLGSYCCFPFSIQMFPSSDWYPCLCQEF